MKDLIHLVKIIFCLYIFYFAIQYLCQSIEGFTDTTCTEEESKEYIMNILNHGFRGFKKPMKAEPEIRDDCFKGNIKMNTSQSMSSSLNQPVRISEQTASSGLNQEVSISEQTASSGLNQEVSISGQTPSFNDIYFVGKIPEGLPTNHAGKSCQGAYTIIYYSTKDMQKTLDWFTKFNGSNHGGKCIKKKKVYVKKVDPYFECREAAYLWKRYYSGKIFGMFYSRMAFFSGGSYLKIPGFDYKEPIDDTMVEIYTDTNKLYDYFKGQDNQLLKDITKICAYGRGRIEGIIKYGKHFLKETFQSQNDKFNLTLLIKEIIKDKEFLTNSIINGIICLLLSIGVFKGQPSEKAKDLINHIRSVFSKLNDVNMVGYFFSYKFLNKFSSKIGYNGRQLTKDEIKIEEEKICNILKDSGIVDLTYNGDTFKITIGGKVFKLQVDKNLHKYANIERKKLNLNANISEKDFNTAKSFLIAIIYSEYGKQKMKMEKLKIDGGNTDFIELTMRLSELFFCARCSKNNPDNLCGEDTEWNEQTQKCEFKLDGEVCGEDTEWNEQTQKCESNPSDDMCGENTKWSAIKDECVVSKKVCGSGTKLNSKTDQCEKDGMCAIM